MYLSPKDTSGRRGWVGAAELALRRTEIKRKTKETKEDMYYVSVRVLHADLIRVRIQHKRDVYKRQLYTNVNSVSFKR